MKATKPLLRGVWRRCTATLAVAGGLSVLPGALPARADVTAQGGARSLGTLINGERSGRCTAGLCVVGGGTAAGGNLFHRLSAFDTRGGIRGVRFQNRDGQTVVVGVTSPWGSWINKTVEFTKPGNLLLFSPGGIHLGPGAGFVGINQLGLSTATRLAMQGGGAFDVFTTIAYDAASLAGAPLLTADGLLVDVEARQAAGITGAPGIVAEGVQVSIDRELLLDAVDGSVQLRDSQLAVQPERGLGGSITLAGQSVQVTGASQLKAQGPSGGGLIQIGGSWQNSDPSVRQALTTSIDPTVVVDASATEAGNGGTIVAWSDVRNALSRTSAFGTFLANAGPQGGDGGRIETSGHGLDVKGIRVSTTAPKGITGLWLLDPTDIIISTSTSSITPSSGTFQDSVGSSTALVSTSDLASALQSSNVTVTTASSGPGLGSITLTPASITVNTPNSLTLQADKDIVFDGNYTNSSTGSIALNAPNGVVYGSGSITLGNPSLGGGVAVVTGALPTQQQTFTGSINAPAGQLQKNGAGGFVLAGSGGDFASVLIEQGSLQFDNFATLGSAPLSTLTVTAGSKLTLNQAAPFTHNITSSGSGSHSIVSCLQSCQITGSLNLQNSLRLELEVSGGGSAELNPVNGIAATASSGSHELQFSGLGTGQANFVVNGHINTGSGGIRLTSNPIVTLHADNQFTGPVDIDSGSLFLDPLGPFEVLADSAPVKIVFGGNLYVSASETIGSLEGDLGSTVVLAPGITFSVGANNSSTIYRGLVEDSNPSSPSLATFRKIGAGTLTLTGSNSYGGTTLVSGGTLTVTGSGPTSATTICSGGSSNLCASPTPTSPSTPLPEQETDPEPETDPDPDPEPETDPERDPDTSDAERRQEEDIANAIEDALENDPINDTQPQVMAGLIGGFDMGNPLTDAPFSDQNLPIAGEPASLEDAQIVASALGETSFQRQDLSVEISLGSSFTTEASELGVSDQSGVGEATNAQTAESSEAPESSADAASSSSSSNQAPGSESTSQTVSIVPAQEAMQKAAEADISQGKDALERLIPEAASNGFKPMSSQAIQQSLKNAADLIRRGAFFNGSNPPPRNSRPAESDSATNPSIYDNVDLGLLATSASLGVQADATAGLLLPPSFNSARYNPAVLHIRFTEEQAASGQSVVKDQNNAFLDLTLIPSQGEAVGRRVDISRADFASDLKQLYRQLSRQEDLDVSNATAPSRRLYAAMFSAIEPTLQQNGITTLLISADRGLQAVPFAALHNGRHFFGDTYAFSLTPSLALTSLAPPMPAQGRLLAAGSAVFDGLAPLPLVPTELEQVGQVARKDKALNRDFTPQTLLELAADHQYSRVHVATHAEFLPGGPASSRLYSGTLPIPLSDFVKLRRERQDAPLDLISFSACRTALGDAESELGFAGLALQSGARSAVGTLWYVDDVATSAYFVQMYRYLDAGIPKAEALQLTRQAFSRGLVRIQSDSVMGPDDRVLISGLTPTQQRRFESGFSHPYFWAGIELLGSAW